MVVLRVVADLADRLRVKLSEPWSLQAHANAAAPIRETDGGLGGGPGALESGGGSGPDRGTGRAEGIVRNWMLCIFQSVNGL